MQRLRLSLGNLAASMACIIANCINQRAPLYLQELCVLVSVVPGRRHLRSADQLCLVINRCRLSSMQKREFAVAGPMAWNHLGFQIEFPSIAKNEYRMARYEQNFMESHIFPGVVFCYFSLETVKLRKLLCVELLFSCELLSKTDTRALFWHFPEELDHCYRGISQR